MKPLRCDFCQGQLVMDPSREFAVCEYCGTKYMKETIQLKIQEITGRVSIIGNVKTKETDFIIQAGVLRRYNGEATDVVIPDNVRLIGAHAFYGMPITSVMIPEGVTEIGDWAFYRTGIKNIELPHNLMRIGDSAFSRSKLQEIQIPDSVREIGSYAFSDTDITSIEIPCSVLKIASSAFSNSKLQKIKIPEGITEIDCGAFEKSMLQNIDIPNSVQKINVDAFKDCVNLQSVRLPEADCYIAFGSFQGCFNLTEIINAKGYSDLEQRFSGTAWQSKRAQLQQQYQEKCQERIMAQRRELGVCQHCGGKFKGVFAKTCLRCGSPKDY